MIRISAAILALACMLVGLQASAKTTTNTHGIAVIIGNKTYPGRIPDAEYAHNDASAMKKFVIDRLGYKGVPNDGRAWTGGNCERRVLRGGSWSDDPWDLRAASRGRFGATVRYVIIGFRVARDLSR
jgi:hypothetical protein